MYVTLWPSFNPVVFRTARTLCSFSHSKCSRVKHCLIEAVLIRADSMFLWRNDTIIILNIGTDRSEQTVQTQIRLLLMEQSDQGLLCLLFCLHLLNTILHCKIQLFQL